MTVFDSGMLAQNSTTAQGRPQLALVVGTCFLAVLFATLAWPVIQHTMTVSHEGGHALFASLFGGTIIRILVDRTGGGATAYKGTSRSANFFILLAGYLGPSFFGLVGTVMLSTGGTMAVLWTSIVLLALTLIQIPLTNVFGLFTILSTGTTFVVVACYAPIPVQTIFSYTWIWLLLIGGFRDVVGFRNLRQGNTDVSSDAAALREATHLPAALWVWLFLLASFAALVLGGAILLGFVGQPDPRT